MRATTQLKLSFAFGAILLLSGAAGWAAIGKLAAIDEGMGDLLSGPVTAVAKPARQVALNGKHAWTMSIQE